MLEKFKISFSLKFWCGDSVLAIGVLNQSSMLFQEDISSFASELPYTHVAFLDLNIFSFLYLRPDHQICHMVIYSSIKS